MGDRSVLENNLSHLLGFEDGVSDVVDYLLTMLEELPPGTYEVCLNPDTDEHADELELLLNPELKQFLSQPGRELINHGDLVPLPATKLPA